MHPIFSKMCFKILQNSSLSGRTVSYHTSKDRWTLSFLSLNSWEIINKSFENNKVDCREKNVALRLRLIDEAALQSFPPRCTQCITITIIMIKAMMIIITIIMFKAMIIMVRIPTIFYIFS